MKNTEIKINVEAREAGYKAAEAAAHAKFNAAQKAYDEACRRFATATAENRADAEKAMNEAHDYCYGEAQAEYDAACKAAFEKFFSLNPTAEEIAAAEAENNIEEIAEINAEDAKVSEDVIETKTGANGNVMFYLNGNRAKEADLVKAAIDKDQPYYRALAQKRGESKCVEEFFLSTITAYKWLCRMARKNASYAEGYMAISLEKVIHTPTCTTLTSDDIYTNKMPVEDIADKHLKDYIKQQTEADAIADDTGNDTNEVAEEIADKPADTVDTPPVKKSFELTVNNERVFFIDGKFDSVFSYTYDAGFATEYSKYYYFERINQKHGCVSMMKLIDDEEEFFALMAEREACTLEPVNNELIVADYEYTEHQHEFGKDYRKFNICGEEIFFYKNAWIEIKSKKFCARITRSMYLNTTFYNLDQWLCRKGDLVKFEPPQYHVMPVEFWAAMYRRGFMQRATPFKLTIEHVDAPATTHEITDMEIFYSRNDDNDYIVSLDNANKIVLGTIDAEYVQDFVNTIKWAFANDAGVIIYTDGTVETVADEDVYILDACAEINRHAPEGWTVTFDTKGKIFPVNFKGKQVATLDSLATQKFLSPEKFFEQFKPLVDKNFTPKDQFLADRYNELAMLEQMREEIADDAAQLKTLNEMIEQVKRDIVSEEFGC